MIEQIINWIQTIPINSACWILVITFIGLDVVIGTFKAYITKTISSAKARQGLMHKTSFIGALLLCNLIDIAQSITVIKDALGFTIPISTLCSIMIISCEIMSICEHIKELNPDIKLDFLKKED